MKLIEVCQAYEIWIAKSLSWFERQLGTSGDAMPVGHPGLPSINRGLDALGIKQSFKDGDDEQNSEEKKKAKELADKAKQFREEEDARIDSEKIERSQRIWSNLASQSNAIKSNGGRIDSLPPMYGSMSDSQLFHAQELQDQYTREAKKLNIRSYVSPQQDINAMRNLNNRR